MNSFRNLSEQLYVYTQHLTLVQRRYMAYESVKRTTFNPLNAKLNPICPLLALLGAHHILHVSR